MAYNEKSKEYTKKYQAKLRQLNFRITTEEYEKIKSAAIKQKYSSIRRFCLDAINEKIKRGA